MKVGSKEYRVALHRHNELVFERETNIGLTAAERAELDELDRALTSAEIAHGRIAPAVDDYTFAVGLAGDLGGVELV